jgi:hypothetical protein
VPPSRPSRAAELKQRRSLSADPDDISAQIDLIGVPWLMTGEEPSAAPARTSSSGVYVPWLVVGHEVRTSNAASTLSPVMVGRDREFAQLQDAWRTGGQMLVVRGRAGIGKSRLVREFANWVRDAGGTVLAG